MRTTGRYGMANLGIAAGAIIGGAALGIGGAMLAKDLAYDVIGNSTDDLYADWEQERASGKQPYDFNVYDPGGVYPIGGRGGIGGGTALGFGVLPGAAAAAFGIGTLVAPQVFGSGPVIGAVLGAAGIALIGASIGAMIGDSQGSKVAVARNGVDLDSQSEAVIERFDADGDGRVDITRAPRTVPEFLRPVAGEPETTTNFISIERTAEHADANGDDRVTGAELREYLGTFDADGNGVLSQPESRAYYDADNNAEVLSVGLDAPYNS